MKRALFAIMFGMVIGSVGLADAGENWAQFRGPTGQGLSAAENLPLVWSNTENVVWKVEIPGEGWSSPIFHEGLIYLTAAVPVEGSENNDLSLQLFCIDAQSGKKIWNREVFLQDGATAPRIHGKNSHASPTPILDGGQIFVHFGHQGIAALDLQGNVLWRNRSIKYAPVHGNGGSPALVGDRLIFSCDGAAQQLVVAVDRQTGQVLWTQHRDSGATKKFSFSTPLLITVDGQPQIISPGSDAVCAYDPGSGREIWRVRYTGYSVIPRPVYGHGLVFMSTGYNTPSILAIDPGGEGDVTDSHVAWTIKKGAPHTPSPLLVGDELYLVSDRGIASCLDAKTGEVHWQERVGGNYSASPLYAEGKVYFQSEQGSGVVVRAGKKFEKLATNELEERTLASYAIGDGALFIRSAKHLYRIQANR